MFQWAGREESYLKSPAGQGNSAPIKSLILLAEDNEATAELTKKMLELFGYQVTIARNGVDAVAKAEAELPDLIVMDIHMPVMDGFQATEEIRRIQSPNLFLSLQRQRKPCLEMKNGA